MKAGKIILKISGIILILLMVSFASCADAKICWICENPHDPSEWYDVCNAHSKAKWESYGYKCY